MRQALLSKVGKELLCAFSRRVDFGSPRIFQSTLPIPMAPLCTIKCVKRTEAASIHYAKRFFGKPATACCYHPLLKEIVVTVCVILSNFPRSFGPTLIHKNKQCWHHLFLPLFLSPIQKYPRNAFFMTKQEKPSFQLLVPLLLWSLHFEELK